MTFFIMWCHWYWHWHQVMLIVSSIVPFYSLGQDDQNKVQHDLSAHVMLFTLVSYHTNGMSKAHVTDASTGTKSHIIPLNNHPNIRNEMVKLMAPTASSDRKHVIATYGTKTIMSSMPHRPISKCAHETTVSICIIYIYICVCVCVIIPHELTAINNQ